MVRPGVHAPEETGGNRRQRDAGFTLRTAVRAWSSVVFLRFNSPPRARETGPGPRIGASSVPARDTVLGPRGESPGVVKLGPAETAGFVSVPDVGGPPREDL